MRWNNDSDEQRVDASRRKILGFCVAGVLGSAGVSASSQKVESNDTSSVGTPATDPVRQRERNAAAERRNSLAQTATPATVEFAAQSSDGTTVTIKSVTIPKDGFVAIHDTRLQQGKPIESVIGVSEYLERGHHENVEVTLFDVPGATYDRTTLADDQTLIAMPHEDTDTNRRYEFVESDGTQDPPYEVGDEPVTDSACVTVDNC